MIWRSLDIFGTTYQMNEFGQIIKRRGAGYLKAFPDKDGYLKYTFCVPGYKGTVNHFIHRLTYQTFIGEIPHGYTVDHIDSDKLNNHYTNYQLLSAVDNAIKGNARHWIVTDPNGLEYQVYNLAAFCKEHNLNRSHMYEVAHGYKNQTQCKGWKCYEYTYEYLAGGGP